MFEVATATEFGDKQMDELFVLNSESDWRTALVTFAKTKVTAVQGSRRPLEKKNKKENGFLPPQE